MIKMKRGRQMKDQNKKGKSVPCSLPFPVHPLICDTFHDDDTEIWYQQEVLQLPYLQGP